jgi:hypothetical protein
MRVYFTAISNIQLPFVIFRDPLVYFPRFGNLYQDAWRSGHRIRLKNEKTWVRIPTGYKVFRET